MLVRVAVMVLAMCAPASAASISFGNEHFSFSISDDTPQVVWPVQRPQYQAPVYDDCWDDACEYAYEEPVYVRPAPRPRYAPVDRTVVINNIFNIR